MGKERILVVNFWMMVSVLAGNLVTVAANWKIAYERFVLHSAIEQLKTRVIALEQGRETHMPQYKMQPLQ